MGGVQERDEGAGYVYGRVRIVVVYDQTRSGQHVSASKTTGLPCESIEDMRDIPQIHGRRRLLTVYPPVGVVHRIDLIRGLRFRRTWYGRCHCLLCTGRTRGGLALTAEQSVTQTHCGVIFYDLIRRFWQRDEEVVKPFETRVRLRKQ